VEDDPLVLELYRDMLERLGHRVETAADGDEAVVRCGAMSTPPSLLMADLMLPGRSGLEVLARLRDRDPDLPAVIVSGHAHFDEGDQAQDRAVFLAKPFQLVNLKTAIDQALDLAGRARGAKG
jgi:CheY-like chemotaxis protein